MCLNIQNELSQNNFLMKPSYKGEGEDGLQRWRKARGETFLPLLHNCCSVIVTRLEEIPGDQQDSSPQETENS